jgi:hypothetical protein
VPNLRENGANDDEIAYLVADQWTEPRPTGKSKSHWSGRRAELNGLVGDEFINFIETRLAEEEARKVIPDQAQLRDAYRRAVVINRLNDAVAAALEAVDRDHIVPPDDLRAQVEDVLQEDRSLSWDLAVAELAEGEL